MNRDNHYARIKEVIDLYEHVESLGSDRPPVGVFFKELNINPQIMSNAVIQTAQAVQMAVPPAAVELVNHLCKLWLTIGYKYAIKRFMEQEFGIEDEQGPNGTSSGGEVN